MASAVDTHGDPWAVGLGTSAENGPGLIEEYSESGQRLHAIRTGPCLPTNVSADRSGDVWVTEVMCAKLQEYNYEGKLVRQFFASSGEGKLSFPVGVASDNNGDIYDLNWATGSERIWKLRKRASTLGTSAIGLGRRGHVGAAGDRPRRQRRHLGRRHRQQPPRRVLIRGRLHQGHRLWRSRRQGAARDLHEYLSGRHRRLRPGAVLAARGHLGQLARAPLRRRRRQRADRGDRRREPARSSRSSRRAAPRKAISPTPRPPPSAQTARSGSPTRRRGS